jgi:hypothetical protein
VPGGTCLGLDPLLLGKLALPPTIIRLLAQALTACLLFLTWIIGSDHLHSHSGDLRSMRKPRGDGEFLRRWPQAYAIASGTLAAGDPAVNGVVLSTVITYPEKCSPWEESSGLAAAFRGERVRQNPHVRGEVGRGRVSLHGVLARGTRIGGMWGAARNATRNDGR